MNAILLISYCRYDKSNIYTMGCPPVRGDNPQALASGLSYLQVDKYGTTNISTVDLAHHLIFRAKVDKGGIMKVVLLFSYCRYDIMKAGLLISYCRYDVMKVVLLFSYCRYDIMKALLLLSLLTGVLAQIPSSKLFTLNTAFFE